MASFSTTIPFASPDIIPANPSKQVRMMLKWSEAAAAVDIPGILADISDEHFEHHLLPEHAVKAMGHALLRNGKEEFKQGFGRVLSLLKTPGPTIHEIIESGNKVMVHARGTGTSVTGHPYTNEWIFIFKFQNDSSGEPKIVEIKEFFDSLYFTQQWPRKWSVSSKPKAN